MKEKKRQEWVPNFLFESKNSLSHDCPVLFGSWNNFRKKVARDFCPWLMEENMKLRDQVIRLVSHVD